MTKARESLYFIRFYNKTDKCFREKAMFCKIYSSKTLPDLDGYPSKVEIVQPR